MEKVSSVQKPITFGEYENGFWWIKFSIDIHHPQAWSVVQELGHIINHLPLNDRLPTSFYPVSPPPHKNGGPEFFLSWIIETEDKKFQPRLLRQLLEERLPRPVSDLRAWIHED